MGLNDLPSELLAHVCSYIHDFYALSLVNHHLRSISSPLLFQSLRAVYPGPEFDEILGFAQSSNSRNVQDLIIKHAGKNRFATYDEDAKSAAEGLVSRVLAFRSLKRFTCTESVLGLLTDDEIQQLEYLRLGATAFRFQSKVISKEDAMDPRPSRILNLTALASLECYVPVSPNYWLTSNGSDDELDSDGNYEVDEPPSARLDRQISRMRQGSKKLGYILSFLSSAFHNLEDLTFLPSYSIDHFDLPAHRMHKLRLTRLDLSEMENIRLSFLQRLGKLCHLDYLQALSLPSRLSDEILDWLASHPMPLIRLQEFQLHIWMHAHRVDGYRDYLYHILIALPPLKKLTVIGPGRLVVEQGIMEHHATLESLTLQDSTMLGEVIYESPWTAYQLEMISQLRYLQHLCIYMHRYRENDLVHWNMLRSSSIKSLTLVLECAMSSNQSESLHDTFKRYALDESLAKSILDICDLDQLHVMTVGWAFSIDAIDAMLGNQEEETEEAITAGLQGNYKCRRRGGRIEVVNMSQKMPRRWKGVKRVTQGTVALREFQEIWPSRGGNWRKEWHAMPIALKDTAEHS